MGIRIEIVGENVTEVIDDITQLAELFGVGDQSLPMTVAPLTTGAGVAPLTTGQPAPPAGANLGIPATVPPPPAPVPELDAAGHPWNAEIHSADKTRKVNGEWRAKRGVDKQRVAEIYAAHTAAPVQPVTAAPVQPGTAGPDPVAACIEMATKALTSTQDPTVIVTISGRVNEIMARHEVPGGSAQALLACPEKAPAILADLTALAQECGVQC